MPKIPFRSSDFNIEGNLKWTVRQFTTYRQFFLSSCSRFDRVNHSKSGRKEEVELKRWLLSTVILATIALVGCSTSSQTKLLAAIDAIPSKHLENYSFDPHSSLISRIKDAPEFALSYSRTFDENKLESAYLPSAQQLQLISEYLDLLPPTRLQLLKDRLVAIYFIDHMQESGVCDWVYDRNHEIFVVQFFNPKTLTTNISDWLSYRESSGFAPDDSSLAISVDAGTKYLAFLYALLHETTHFVDYVTHVTPFVEPNVGYFEGSRVTSTKFTDHVWASYRRPTDGFDFTDRDKLTFYGIGKAPTVPLSRVPQLYHSLTQSPFVTLYATQAWAEDLADCFMWYYLTQKLGQPFVIKVMSKSHELASYTPSLSQQNMDRLKVLETLSN